MLLNYVQTVLYPFISEAYWAKKKVALPTVYWKYICKYVEEKI